MTYSSRDHNGAFLAAVRAVWPSVGRGARVGDGDVPQDLTFPYAVVYPFGSTTFDGPLEKTKVDDDAWPTTQVTFVGETREQAELLQDKVRAAIVGMVLVVPGRKLSVMRLLTELPPSKDTTVTPYVFWAVDQYRAFSSPA